MSGAELQPGGNGDSMELVHRIWSHPLFQECLQKVEQLEKDRIFCGHGRTHLFDVARIAYIDSLERSAQVPKYMIYAAALLHDIGRCMEYTDGVPHHEASAKLAGSILRETGFSDDASKDILRAVYSHRDRSAIEDPGLSGLIYRADKRSRCCFACAAESECDWPAPKKNMKWSI